MDYYELLLVEDNDLDARLVRRQLAREGSFKITHVETIADCKRHLSEKTQQHAVLLDLGLPDSAGGLDALKQVHPMVGDVPIIVLTGLADEETGIEAVREGAQDYVVKENVSPESLSRTVWSGLNDCGRRICCGSRSSSSGLLVTSSNCFFRRHLRQSQATNWPVVVFRPTKLAGTTMILSRAQAQPMAS